MYDFGIRQARSGYRVAYREHEPNHCPGCGQSQWIIGRTTAECAFCATAIPINTGGASGSGVTRSKGAAPAPIAA